MCLAMFSAKIHWKSTSEDTEDWDSEVATLLSMNLGIYLGIFRNTNVCM